MTETERKELFENLNYMNMAELKKFCETRNIPYKIQLEMLDGRIKQTSEMDRKGIIIPRIKEYILTGKIGRATLFPKQVIGGKKLPQDFNAESKVLHGQFKSTNKKIIALLKELTNGKFFFGAIALIVIKKCWAEGYAPSYAEFAKLWLQAMQEHTQPKPEWAYLTDLNNGVAGSDWKKLRIQKANAAIKMLSSL